jgi:hypothetical protein
MKCNQTNTARDELSGFRREVDENGAFLGYYAAYSGNSLPTFRDNILVPSSRVENSRIKWSRFLGFVTLEDGIDRLSRNVGKELPLHAVQ